MVVIDRFLRKCLQSKDLFEDEVQREVDFLESIGHTVVDLRNFTDDGHGGRWSAEIYNYSTGEVLGTHEEFADMPEGYYYVDVIRDDVGYPRTTPLDGMSKALAEELETIAWDYEAEIRGLIA